MAKRQLPSPEVLRQLLRYEPETGQFFWKERGPEWFSAEIYQKAFNTRYAGAEALTGRDKFGYLSGSVQNCSVKAHRVAWAHFYGVWPACEVDHINGDKSDNRIDNLRDVTRSVNGRNLSVPVRTNGMPQGVWIDKRKLHRPFRAKIEVSGKQIHLGGYATPNEAHAAYLAAAKRYGFTDRHIRALPIPNKES